MTLRDALAEYDEFYEHDQHLTFEPVLAAAARRVAEVSEVWWCAYHDGAYRMFHYPTCPHAAHTGDDSDCRMVRKLLVDPPEQA